MFGYVKALTPELKVKEFELYRSVYCGLCHHIKKRGSFMTFSLSYDFVLPSLFSLAFTDVESISFKKKRCLAHPLRKRKVIDGGENMQAVADAAILLVYYKLLDDNTDKDEKLGKKIYITGKGRCNFTNDTSPQEFMENIVRGKKFLTGALYAFPPEKKFNAKARVRLTSRSGRREV